MAEGRREKREQTLGEEIANSVSHGVALLATLGAAPLLVVEAGRRGHARAIVGAAVFLTSAALLYTASTLYHALAQNRAKKVFKVLDHSAIFLLIAGTYTPFTLGVLYGPWGFWLLGIVWALAVVGVLLKATGRGSHPVLSSGLYIGMGWLIVVAARPLLRGVPLSGILWLLAGGLAYTAGVAFYSAERLRYSHFVFHLFVMAGTACHYVAVLRYAG